MTTTKKTDTYIYVGAVRTVLPLHRQDIALNPGQTVTLPVDHPWTSRAMARGLITRCAVTHTPKDSLNPRSTGRGRHSAAPGTPSKKKTAKE